MGTHLLRREGDNLLRNMQFRTGCLYGLPDVARLFQVVNIYPSRRLEPIRLTSKLLYLAHIAGKVSIARLHTVGKDER